MQAGIERGLHGAPGGRAYPTRRAGRVTVRVYYKDLLRCADNAAFGFPAVDRELSSGWRELARAPGMSSKGAHSTAFNEGLQGRGGA